ncbi:hypothetical protein [Burkholderia sp. BCC1970]|uniref:hypothetical protein n=1 Tax=Burkholderia sp. BCC1970 TaxID=2817437 RepID=UPI002ABDFAE6|nr:hypothetical protein [Burkholderia sp. BCC1970]
MEALGRFAILNAVEVTAQAPRSSGIAGVEHGRSPCRRARRDGAGMARAPPVASSGRHAPAPSRIGTSVSIHVH